ncbi:MAG: MBL fold metallo-hydrolase [Betaproteobacteria bacterium]|nr:MBL fold metallo-hydrolase [Betaproteobacteria bacterium]
MLQRSQNAAFVAGAFVFPGGALDEGDGGERMRARVLGLDDAEANARLNLPTGAIAYYVGAARECFEEAGILLAVDEHGAAPEPAHIARLAREREALNAGTLGFLELLERERLCIPADRMAYLSHWITAPGRTRRYTTRFFVARAPAGQDGAHDDAETVASAWIRPQAALDRNANGEIELVFPTRSSLVDLARFATAAEAFEHAAGTQADIEVNAACWAVGNDGKKLFRRADPAYAEIHWCDPDETGETCYDIVPGVAKRLDPLVTRITAPNPGAMTGPGTNAYLVGDDELAVIDPGPDIPAHVDALLAAGKGRIRWILATHTHTDHSPAARALQTATGAQVIGRAAPAGNNQDRGFAPQRQPTDGERLQLGTVTLRAIATPGHASNHLCYLLEQTGMLFTGDHVMQGSTVVINPPDGNMRTYLDSLERLLSEDFAVFAPGHGYLIGTPAKEVRKLIRHRLARESKVVRALAQLGRAMPEELVRAVYDDVQERLHPVALRSLAAHLDKLAQDGRARCIDGAWGLVDAP